MAATIYVFYSCKSCDVVDAPCAVPVRASSTAVNDWISETVAPALAADHMQRSPHCDGRKADIKVPMNPAGIGFAAVVS